MSEDVDPSLEECLRRLHKGDATAADVIFQRFARRLVGLARKRLDDALSRKVDPEDVIQSVFQSFFAAQQKWAAGLHDWDDLWSLLAVFTVRKCSQHLRHFRTERRDVRREANAAKEDVAEWESICREPTPVEALVFAETLDQLLTSLQDQDRQIVLLKLQGFTTPEISSQVKRSERTVQRVLKEVRNWLERHQGGEQSPAD